MSYTIDRHDIALLEKVLDQSPFFAKSDMQETRLRGMHEVGLVRRTWTTYRSSQRQREEEMRWAYSLTAAGWERLGSALTPSQEKSK